MREESKKDGSDTRCKEQDKTKSQEDTYGANLESKVLSRKTEYSRQIDPGKTDRVSII